MGDGHGEVEGLATRMVDSYPVAGLALVDGEDGLDGSVVDRVGLFGALCGFWLLRVILPPVLQLVCRG